MALAYATAIVVARPFEVPGGAASWYPAAGVLLAWLIVDGRRAAPLALVVRVVVSFMVHHPDGGIAELIAEVIAGVVVVAIYSLAAASARRSLAVAGNVARYTRFAVFVVFPAAAGAAIATSVATTVLDGGRPGTALEFFVGDAIGSLAVAPFVLALLGFWRPAHDPTLDQQGRAEVAIQTVALVVPPVCAALAQIDGLFLAVLVVGLAPMTLVAARRDVLHLGLAVLVTSTSAALAARWAIEEGVNSFDDLLVVQTMMLSAVVVAFFVNANRLDDLHRAAEALDAERRVTWAATHDAGSGALNRQGLALAAEAQPDDARLLAVDIGIPTRTLRALGQRFTDEVTDIAAERIAAVVGDVPVARVDTGVIGTITNDAPGLDAYALPRLLAEASAPIVVDGVEVHPEPRVGISSPGAPGEHRVEQALFAVNLARRRGVPWLGYDAVGDIAATERSRLADLRRAIGAGEITAWFQPIVRVDDRAIVGVESLARWGHPTLGVVGADQFIETAEASGLVPAVGRAVRASLLDCATQLSDVLRADGFRFAFNVSPLEIDHGFVDDLLAALESARVDPTMLKLEVTEAAALGNIEAAYSVLARVRDAGVSVSIDDFGTGHASIAQLHRLPIDEVKIDGMFVRGLPSARDMAIVRSIRSIADEFEFDVVAEGAETGEQLDALRDCGIERVQGDVVGRPMPADELIDVLSRQRDERAGVDSTGAD